MREIEFLPDWYPQLVTRHRHLRLQAWLTLAVIFTFVLWVGLSIRNIHVANRTLTQLRGQRDQSEKEVARMTELETLQRQGQERSRVFASLGVEIGSTKLLELLNDVLPKEASLSRLSIESEEVAPSSVVNLLARARGNEAVPMDHRVKVRLTGVCPTETESAALIARLSSIPFLSNVALKSCSDRQQGQIVMREFEAEFQILVASNEVN